MPRILWTANPLETAERHPGARVGVPSLLVSALPPPALAAWLEGAPWAATVPIVLVSDADAGAAAEAADFVARHERRRSGGSAAAPEGRPMPGGGALDFVVGPPHLTPPAALLARLHRDEVTRTIELGLAIGRALRRADPGARHVVWEVGADRTGGVLAVGLAMATGRAVAVAGSAAGPLFVAATVRHHVDVVGDLVALDA